MSYSQHRMTSWYNFPDVTFYHGREPNQTPQPSGFRKGNEIPPCVTHTHKDLPARPTPGILHGIFLWHLKNYKPTISCSSGGGMNQPTGAPTGNSPDFTQQLYQRCLAGSMYRVITKGHWGIMNVIYVIYTYLHIYIYIYIR